MKSNSGTWLIWRVLLLAQVRQQPARLIIMVLVIAIGVALGTAVYLVNKTALNEFTLATKRLVGEADLVIRGPAQGFSENLYPVLSKLDPVSNANPVLELETAIPGRHSTLKILGLDVLRAGELQPGLLADIAGGVRQLFAANAIFLSVAAAAELKLKAGDDMSVVVGDAPVKLHVLGILSASSYSQSLGIMDIASAQWVFKRIGKLNRIDLRLNPGVDVKSFRRQIATLLPAGVLSVAPDVERDRAVTVTRAYRINLNMLALVSLLTSAFLVFSIQSLSMLRRRASIALLRALGATRRQVQSALLAEGAVIGAIGAALGIALGSGVAAIVVRILAGDFGNGQLRVTSTVPDFDAAALFVAFVIGTSFACAGAWIPAREAARRDPARALKSGDAEQAVRKGAGAKLGVALALLGVLLVMIPAHSGIPFAGYAAIAALLFGIILWVPLFTQVVLSRVPRTHAVSIDTALAQLNASHGLLFLSLAPIIVSFALMVAMAIMVHSFRESFDGWLIKMLPSDLQIRLPAGNQTAAWSSDDQAELAHLAGVARVDFRRTQQIYLSAEREPVTLIAREINFRSAGDVLPLQSSMSATSDQDCVWVSEAAQDKFGFNLGRKVAIPINGVPRNFLVAGVWRDYARTSGALVIARATYVKVSGDSQANEASVWLTDGAVATTVESEIQSRYAVFGMVEILTSGELRLKSLSIFDRAFAVTYALEALAVIIGLAGISVAASFTALTRRAEFGMLRHLGMLRSQILRMLAAEGVATAILGTIYGLGLGFILSLLLVFVINRQSFNWSIDLSVPARQLMIFAGALIIAAALTAILSGRAALSQDAIRAVREDW